MNANLVSNVYLNLFCYQALVIVIKLQAHHSCDDVEVIRKFGKILKIQKFRNLEKMGYLG